jgi:hypothetical protein
VRALLDFSVPTGNNWKPTNAQCKAVYQAIEGISNNFGYLTGYNWQSVVGKNTCKRFFV